MKYQQWSKDIQIYELPEGFSIEKAPWEQFAPWWTVYVIFEDNIWFRQSYEMALSVLKDCEICYWIKKDGKRIGGVLMEPNYMNCLYLEPPFSDYGKMVVILKNLLVSWSDSTKDIMVGGARPKEINYYQRAGFRSGQTRRCMIRPTESFDISWDEDYIIAEPSREDGMEIAKLLHAAFHGGVGYQGTVDLEGHKKDGDIYFKYFGDNELLKKASTLIYDKNTNELIGTCLVSLWEECPLIYDVAVHPDHQGRGLASKMIKKALTVAKEQYPVLKLFVTLGNDAELVYHKLGFMAGTETTEMIIPSKK
jgi:GNAT superfamily N-acetyltransferase